MTRVALLRRGGSASSRSSSQIVERKRKEGSVIYRMDRAGTGDYFVNDDSSQAKFIREINFKGFHTFPKTLYPTGFGFKVSGNPLLKALRDKYGAKLRITL